MAITVEQLIKKLQKMPKSANVAVALHDQSEGEVSGWPLCVACGDEVIEAQYGETVILYC